MPLWFKLVAGSAFFVLAIWVGLTILRGLARPANEEGDVETQDIEDEDVRYRCASCGMELRMTRTPGDDAKPPRHCLEEMERVGKV